MSDSFAEHFSPKPKQRMFRGPTNGPKGERSISAYSKLGRKTSSKERKRRERLLSSYRRNRAREQDRSAKEWHLMGDDFDHEEDETYADFLWEKEMEEEYRANLAYARELIKDGVSPYEVAFYAFWQL